MIERRGTEDDGDPTADFLADVVPGETPWRTERPADPAPEQAVEAHTVVRPAQKWARTRAVGRGAAKAAPYVQAAAVVGWLVTEAFEAGHNSGGSA
jgi:hypothetical protein